MNEFLVLLAQCELLNGYTCVLSRCVFQFTVRCQLRVPYGVIFVIKLPFC